MDTVIEMISQNGTLFVLAGTFVVFCGVFGVVTRGLRGQSRGPAWFNVGMGLAIAAIPQYAPWMLGTMYSLLGGADKPVAETPDPEPAPEAFSLDLSWVPGVLVVVGVIAGACVFAAGLFHYYSRSLRPSLLKTRSEAQTAATLVAEARKTLERVVLGSASYETDLSKQIDYPMMTDVSEPLVGKYVREMRQAQERERALVKKPLLSDAQHFSDAVTNLKVSYEAAVRKAERVRWSSFTVAEQKRLKDARIALDVIQDSSTTAEQRNAQYKRIAKLLDGLIVLTEPVKQSLAAWVPMLALEDGSRTAPLLKTA